MLKYIFEKKQQRNQKTIITIQKNYLNYEKHIYYYNQYIVML